MTTDDLLAKYLLNEYACNREQFLKINKLKSASTPLSINTVYQLPIAIYKYNDISIRTSLKISDIDIARLIQAYNERIFKVRIRQQSYQQSQELLVPFHALTCPNSRVPKTQAVKSVDTEGGGKPRGVTTRTYAIFGRKYQDVPLLDKKLKNKIFYVEGGHGGPDPGAMAKVEGRSLCEDEYAYDVSLRVARELIKHGATVYIINRDNNDGIRDGDFLLCDNDEVTYPDLKVPIAHKPRLTQRSDAVNKLYEAHRKKGITDQRLIVIHVDSRSKKDQTDTFLYYQSGNATSKKIALTMLKTLETNYAKYREKGNAYEGSLTSRDLHMLRECKPNTVYVELGNIRNEFDRKRIMIKNNRQAIANWLAEGFMK